MKLFYSAFAVAMLSLFPADVSAENYLVREDRVWEYTGDVGNSDIVYFTYKMHFKGTEVVDGKEYQILHTTDGKEYKYAGSATDFEAVELGDGHSFLMR